MSKKRYEGSELLHAYVDGELDASEKARVEQWLDTHPEDAKRVQEWQKQKAGINFLFAGKADQDVPEHLLPTHQSRTTPKIGTQNAEGVGPGAYSDVSAGSPSGISSGITAGSTAKRWAPLSQIAAAILLLAIGSLGGWFGNDYLKAPNSSLSIATVAPDALTSPAMEAHWVYTPEVRHPVEVTSDERTHLAKWLSYRLDEPLTIPDLSTEGFLLMGGRLLPSSTGPAAQFMYENTEGRRVTVYLSRFSSQKAQPNTKSQEIAFQFQQRGSTRAFYWYDGPLGYVVIGDIEHTELSKIANSIFKRI